VALDAVFIGTMVAVPEIPLPVVAVLEGVVLAFGGVGAVVATRLPANPIGWILWAAGGLMAFSLGGTTYAGISVTVFDGTLPGTLAVATFAQVDFVPLIGAVGVFVPLLFPTGRLPSPRWRLAALISSVGIVIASLVAAVTPGTLSGGSDLPNPLGIDALAGATDVLGLISAVTVAVPFVLAVISLIVRFRHARGIERQQLKWFAGAAATMVIAVALGSSNIGFLADSGWLVSLAGLALLPIGVGTAILRYRLYEIDRIISRTIGWAGVTGLLVAVFGGVVVALQALLEGVTQGQTLAVAASTLVAFALFQPLRRGVQAAVDRRFDRARYNGQLLAEAFATRVRDEVDLGRLRFTLVATADHAVRPVTAGVWLRPGADG
jgi:hypothetical protein